MDVLLVLDGRALPWGVGPAGRWVRVLCKYLDPAGDSIGLALRTRHMEVLKFPGTVLVAWWPKGSRVTWRLAVYFKMC